jgi:hypothetical protein
MLPRWWEDDPVQSADPNYRGGANHPSLNEAKENFRNLSYLPLPTNGAVVSPRSLSLQVRHQIPLKVTYSS